MLVDVICKCWFVGGWVTFIVCVCVCVSAIVVSFIVWCVLCGCGGWACVWVCGLVVVGQRLRLNNCWGISPLGVERLVCGFPVVCGLHRVYGMGYCEFRKAWDGAIGQSHRLGGQLLHVVAIATFSVDVGVVLVVVGHVVVPAVVVAAGVVVVCS